MAKLISEDTDCMSCLSIAPSPAEDAGDEHPGQVWQNIELGLASGARQLSENCLLCRHPQDELGKLFGLLSELIDGKRDEIRFEPAEPSFELNIERAGEGGFKAEIWIDSGNASTGFYRWDAAGIRFFTSLEGLANFREGLEKEFLSGIHNSSQANSESPMR
jgi:hypothetical protein